MTLSRLTFGKIAWSLAFLFLALAIVLVAAPMATQGDPEGTAFALFLGGFPVLILSIASAAASFVLWPPSRGREPTPARSWSSALTTLSATLCLGLFVVASSVLFGFCGGS